MFLHLPLLPVLSLLLDSANSAAATTLWHILCWTPQLLWGLCANGLLIGLVLKRKRIHKLGGVLWLPAAMVLAAILIIRFLNGVTPFAGLLMPHYPEAYADDVVPSMWMLKGLSLLYGWAILMLWYDTRQQQPRSYE
jgi:hypothetical protein